MEVVASLVEIRDDRVPSPIAIAVDDVAPVSLAQQHGVEPRIVGPIAGPRSDADLELVVSHDGNPRL
jgi:hypothetical protein